LSIAHQRETFVPVDEAGQPLTHGILWLDERARDLLPSLAEAADPAAFHRLTGKPLSVNLTFAKIAWLRANRPDVFARAARYLDVHSFLVHRLTDQYRTGWGCADPTGLFDLQANEWAAPLLRQIGLRPEQLPELSPPGAVIGVVTPAAAEACGLPVGLPVAAGLGDGQAGGLGVNVTGRALLTSPWAPQSSPARTARAPCAIPPFGR
jgi:xylulokinase